MHEIVVFAGIVFVCFVVVMIMGVMRETGWYLIHEKPKLAAFVAIVLVLVTFTFISVWLIAIQPEQKCFSVDAIRGKVECPEDSKEESLNVQ